MYTLELLSESKFNKLPYKNAETSFGLADYKNKKAYVRETGIPALDILNAGHEIQELLADVSPHEINGIRYKSSGGLLSILAPVAIGLLTGGTGFALAPWFGSAATGALLGGAASAGLAGGKPSNWLTSGALGALGAGGAAGAGSSLFGSAAKAATDPTMLMAQGAKTGMTAGYNRGVLGSAGNLLWNGAKNMGTNAVIGSAINAISPQQQYGQYSSYGPTAQQPYIPGSGAQLGNTQNVRPTPSSAAGSYTNNAVGSSADVGRIGAFNPQVPGLKNQGPAYSWR